MAFLIQRDTVQICTDRSRALPVTDPFDRELLIICCAASFNLCAALSRFGSTYDSTTFPYLSELDVLALLHVHPPGHLDREIAPLVPAITRRVTDRHAFPMESIAPGTQAAWIHPSRSSDGMPAYSQGVHALLDFATPIVSLSIRTFDVGGGWWRPTGDSRKVRRS